MKARSAIETYASRQAFAREMIPVRRRVGAHRPGAERLRDPLKGPSAGHTQALVLAASRLIALTTLTRVLLSTAHAGRLALRARTTLALLLLSAAHTGLGLLALLRLALLAGLTGPLLLLIGLIRHLRISLLRCRTRPTFWKPTAARVDGVTAQNSGRVQ